MDTQNEARERVLQDIIERELAMFLAAPNEGGPAACQQRPETFRLMRWMAHAVHDNATLLSYLRDLEEAESNGRNFMIEKYARMDDRIPPLSANPRITAIADAEALWLEEAARRYPLSLRGNGGDMFHRYISCELETLSDQTLDLYFREVRDAREENRNMVEERHNLLCRRLGYASLAAREAALRQQAEE